MLIEAHCFDSLPKYIDVSSPLVGDDFSPDDECDDIQETCLALFGRSSIGDSVCVFYNAYQPWSRILSIEANLDIHTVKKHVVQSLSLEYNDVKIIEESRPKFFGFVSGIDGAKKFQCFKIYFKTFELVRKFENIWRYSGGFKKTKAATGSAHFLTSHFESTDFNTPPNIKALNELNLCPSAWFRVSQPVASSRRFTTCKIEGRVTSLEPLDLTGLAPIKIMSFDAEMYSHDNSFPDVLQGDFTTAICASIMIYGSKERRRKAFVLWDGVLDVTTPDLTVEYADSSDDLLEKFRDFVASEDPDIITGWNIYGFDMPFLWDQYESSHSKRSERGSEQMRQAMAKALGREFFTVKDLAAKCPSFDFSKSIEQIRWKLAAKKPDQFPERIASNARGVLRAKLNMTSEESNFSLQDFETLKQSNIPYFNAVMAPPRRESGRRFEYLSRFVCEKSQLSEKRMASSAKGDNTYYYWSGRTCVDLMQIIKDDKKLDENTLKFCAQTFLDPEYGKIDLSPAEIFKAYREKDSTKMAAMLDYCARDADIPLDLIQKLSYVSQWFEMSRVSFTPIAQVLNGGQQRKVFNLISHFVHNSHAMNTGLTDCPESNDDGSSDYQGATVIEPKTGFYTESVSTLDFESLYPSIIIHFNLCPSVYVRRGQSVPESFHVEQHSITHTIQDKTFEQSYGFVKNVQGIIPQLLQSLLKSRKAAKKAMNSAPNEFEKAVQNGRQLALKISCNSVYGFFGVNEKRGLLSCKPIAAVTTLRGRSFIEAAKNYVESTYTGSQVLYGDTDSIMIKWSSTDDVSISKAYKLAEEASASITQLLRNGLVEGASKPMLESALGAVTLANEKVYSPYLLIQKKTYAGLKYELKSGHSPESDDDFSQCIDMKGIDAVRRDRSKLVKTISGNILQSLLFKKDIKSAIQGLLDDVNKVADGSAPLDWFVLSKSLKGTYKTENQPHVQAWLRMTKRGDDEVPEIGSRMPYVIVHSKKKGPLYEQTEHPDYVRRAGLKYCPKYYLENARDVVERLLSPTTEAHKVTQIFTDALHAADRRTSGNMSLLSFFKKV
jgi:DNA polymerase elongation subunit (family B)